MKYNYFATKAFRQAKQEKNRTWGPNDIKKDFQASKFFLTLHFNDFAFEWQLIKQHNLTKSQIQKYAEKLNEIGLISFRMLSELSENMQEAILKVTPDFNKIYSQNPKVYIITPAGKELGKQVVTDVLKNVNSNQGLYDLVQQLMRFSKSFRSVKAQILKEEKTLFERQVKYPGGIVILKDTKKKVELLRTMKIFQLSRTNPELLRNEDQKLIGHSQNAIVPVGNNQVMVLDEKTELMVMEAVRKELNKTQRYDGIYSHLTSTELDEIMKDVTDKDIKEHKKEMSDKVKVLKKVRDLDFECIRHKGKTLTRQEKDGIYQDGLNFLESLEDSLQVSEEK